MDQDKLKKLHAIQAAGYQPYPEHADKHISQKQFLEQFDDLLKSKKNIWLAGRVMSFRGHGKIVFADIQDFSGKIQVVFQENETKDFSCVEEFLDLGDFICIEGAAFLPKTENKSILAASWKLASKSLINFPKEYYKVRDEELLSRAPYLKTIFYEEEREIYARRFAILRYMREILWEHEFIEVETPILQTHYGGALATPFKTHLEALDEPLYLRIAPEIHLKKFLVGGFEKIFEIGKNFRNEGVDREHNPEFTMMELYWTYQNRDGLLRFTQKILQELVRRTTGNLLFDYQGEQIDFSGDWPIYDYTDLIKRVTDLDYFKNTLEDFLDFAKREKIEFNPKIITKGKIVDEIFKKKIRPTMITPQFLINHPKDISPLAKSDPQNPDITLRFQFYIAGMECGNAFAELNDPLDQKERFEEQEAQKEGGDMEAHPFDETFIEALKYGMPPTAGLGIGMDRIITILTNQPSMRRVIYFPFVKE